MKLIFIDTLTFNKFSEIQDITKDDTVVLLNNSKSKTISVSNFKFLLETNATINFLNIIKSTDRFYIGFAIGNYFTKNFYIELCPDEIVFYSKDEVYIEISEMLEKLFKTDITVYGIESNLILEDTSITENEQQVNDANNNEGVENKPSKLKLKGALKEWKAGRLSDKEVKARFSKQQIHNELVTLYGTKGSVLYRKHFKS